MIFPELSGIVKQNAGDEQVEIELRIKRRDHYRHPHHLGDVLDEPAAARVMIRTRAGGAAKTLAMLRYERFTERAQSRIFKRARPFDDVLPVRRLLRAQFRR